MKKVEIDLDLPCFKNNSKLKEVAETLNKGPISQKAIEDKDIKGIMSIKDLLKYPYQTYIYAYELPQSVKDLISTEEVNAVIHWYLNWKKTTPKETQTTCEIIRIFGFYDGTRAIIAVNFFKYLRLQSYDPDIVEKFKAEIR